MRNNLLRIISVILLIIVVSMIIVGIAERMPKHYVKITYSVGGAERVYIVKSEKVSYNDKCISFTDDLGYQHRVCGTFETQIIK